MRPRQFPSFLECISTVLTQSIFLISKLKIQLLRQLGAGWLTMAQLLERCNKNWRPTKVSLGQVAPGSLTSVYKTTDRLQCLQQGQETRENRKTTPHYRWFLWAGIKTIGAMMLPFGCNTSQPIPNILADTFFSKNGQVKFWPDNENVGSVLKKSDISLLQLVVNRNERC